MFSITTNVLANPEDSGLPSKKPNIQNTTSDNLKTNQLINKEVPFSARSSYYQNTFSNYEYERNGNIYKLRNKNKYAYKNKYKDKTVINEYVSAVDNLNNAEWAIVASGGATATGVAIADVTYYNLSLSNCKRVWNLYVD